MVEKAELNAYLRHMGFRDSQIAEVFTLLEEAGDRGLVPPAAERPLRRGTAIKQHAVYLAEEQQILREAYQSFLSSHPNIRLLGSSGDTTGETLVGAITNLKADALLLGIKVLQATTMEKLEMVREQCPEVGIVLLSASYDLKGLKALREFTRRASMGCAFLLKHTIDTVEQLIQVIQAVTERRIILDPLVMEGLISTGDAQSTLLKELSPRELEVLSWMAKGHRNETIAELLFLEPKTVERHINSIYSKLGGGPGSRHSRVQAVLLYLKAAGLLPEEHLGEE